MSTDSLNDEELCATWLKAEAELYTAHQDARSAAHAEVAARNRLSEAKKLENEAWEALAAHRVKVVNGRA